MSLQRNCLALFFVPGIEICTVCSDKILWLINDHGSLCLIKFIQAIIRTNIYRIYDHITDSTARERFSIPLFNLPFIQIAHNIAKRSLWFSVHTKHSLNDFCFLWDWLIHLCPYTINRSFFQPKTVGDFPAHIKAAPAAGTVCVNHALLDSLTLQLCEDHHDHQHSLSNRRSRIELFHCADKINTVLLKYINHTGEVQHRAADTIQTIDNDPADFSGLNVCHHLLKCRTVRVFSAISLISIDLDIFPYHFPFAKFGLALHGYAVDPVNRLSCINCVDQVHLLLPSSQKEAELLTP